MYKSSLYKEYIESKCPNRKVIEIGDDGFFEYEILNKDEVYVWALYVRPGKRGSSLVRDMEKIMIGRENPKRIICDVELGWTNPEQSLGIILHGGYKILNVDEKNFRITLEKHLE